jgi:two-component system, LytTR family, response regulator
MKLICIIVEDEPLALERTQHYVVTTHKKIMPLQTFGELEQEIPAPLLCRVHKSYMVAIDKIEAIERDRIKIGDTLIPISETYREAFFQWIMK